MRPPMLPKKLLAQSGESYRPGLHLVQARTLSGDGFQAQAA